MPCGHTTPSCCHGSVNHSFCPGAMDWLGVSVCKENATIRERPNETTQLNRLPYGRYNKVLGNW